jgi:HD-GYP domain-containing protein (c-di-GMP phosphodiesterase class II)
MRVVMHAHETAPARDSAPVAEAPASAAAATAEAPHPGLWRLYRPLFWSIALLIATAAAGAAAGTDWRVVAAIVAMGNVADLFAVRIQRGMRVSTTHFSAPFAVIATTATGGIVAAAACLLGRLILNRRDFNAFDVAVNVVAAGICGATWIGLHQLGAGDNFLPAVIAVASFALARAAINYGWTMEARAGGIDIPLVNASISRLQIVAAVLFTPAILLFVDQRAHIASALLLLALPFAATTTLVRSFGRERDLNDDLLEANLSMIESLANALDARDPYTSGHSLAVAVYSRDIAAEIRLPDEHVERIYLAGLLHDIGKIAVRDAVLLKPAALDADEFEEIKLHPVAGEQILAPASHFAELLPAVRSHHERIDGKGYPDGLVDEEIPLDARIIAVADAWNAMTSDRPYRDAMHPELARRIIQQNAGSQHDQFLVYAFLRVLDANDMDYALGLGERFERSRDVAERMLRARRAA